MMAITCTEQQQRTMRHRRSSRRLVFLSLQVSPIPVASGSTLPPIHQDLDLTSFLSTQDEQCGTPSIRIQQRTVATALSSSSTMLFQIFGLLQSTRYTVLHCCVCAEVLHRQQVCSLCDYTSHQPMMIVLNVE